MARPEKEAAVAQMVEIFEKSKGVFLTDFQGLNVEKMSDLRQKCREASVGYLIVKNTLARLAVQQVGWDDMLEHLQGPSAIAYSFDDPSAPARVIGEFAKKEEKPVFKVSFFEGVFYGPDKMKAIATLPSKDVLLAKLMGGLNGPIQGFVGSLQGLLSKLVMTVDAVRQSKEEA